MSDPKDVNNIPNRKKTAIPKTATRICNHPNCDRQMPNEKCKSKCLAHLLEYVRNKDFKIQWSDDVEDTLGMG